MDEYMSECKNSIIKDTYAFIKSNNVNSLVIKIVYVMK